MKLLDQVTSLELSKKLKGLGVKQDGHYKWVHSRSQGWIFGETYYNDGIDFVSAFTVAELGELLPTYLRLKGIRLEFVSRCDVEGWEVGYETVNGKWASIIDKHENIVQFSRTESSARGKMLVYLLENKLLS